MSSNPLPQLIPACERVAKACGVEMPERFVWIPYSPDKDQLEIPDDLYALMLVGWVVERVIPNLSKQGIDMRVWYDWGKEIWQTDVYRPREEYDMMDSVSCHGYEEAGPAYTAALTAACDILDGRGEVG